VLLGCVGREPAPERVVLVTIDTLRADYVGAYGAEQARTPTLDEIAREGVRFETAIAPTPLTLPSHVSLMTGLEPAHHGVHGNVKFQLEEGIPVLAERFQEAGFASAAFVGAVVLDRRFGLARGFDVYDDAMGFPQNAPRGGGFPERNARRVVDSALAWLRDAPDRYFLWVHVYDPHANYTPPPGYRPPARPAPDPEAVGFLRAVAASVPAPYAGEIAFADAQLGRLLRGIRERDGDDTLLVVTSDHGESLGEHGELTHALTLYDATQRVPLLMRGPGIPAGNVVRAPVRLVDVAPTVLSLFGLPPIPDTTGRDLGPWIRGERNDPLDAVVTSLVTQLDYGWSPVLGLRTQRYKYLRAPRPELYDLVADPGETRNLAGQQTGLLKQIDARLAARLRGARPVRPNATVPPGKRALLESLGYAVGPAKPTSQPLGWVGGPDPKDRVHAIVATMEASWHLSEGRAERALEVLDTAPEAGGWIAQARARAALELGDPVRAERHAREMAAAQPDYEEGFVLLGQALEAQGRHAEARSAYEEAARVSPHVVEPLLAIGRLAEREGDLEGAAAHYAQAASGRAPSVDAALRLAALRFDQGRADEARRTLDRVGDARGAGPDAVIRLARAQSAAGDDSDALARLSRSIELAPDPAALVAAYEELARGAAGSATP
jgi:arylsulfatase A-like enzyme